ncbi:putative structural protein [Erwinia phage pEa_SNUABM_12]|uniref:Putative structural protein n=1 Tax=Erwinia phage pEa_SNUABM_12 TaxID=2768773 RepID=A0A7L8ZLI1_9CAUD|nr:putative structural protein [Erwinia phage pEa_SNUABM_12]
MAYIVKGDLDAKQQITVQEKTVGVNFTTTDNSAVYSADTSGHVDLPITTSSDVDYIFKQLPLSQYGAINSVPLGVAGTFDGGSTIPYYSSMPVLLENDGTLAFLRPGSNGSTINYYYTYINTPDSSTVPNTTIRKYYEGPSKKIVFYDSYTKDTLIYEDIDNHIIHLVLTNGTLDKNSHQEGTFSNTLIPYNILTALKVGSYVYIIALYNTAYNLNNPVSINYNIADPLQFVFYRVPVSEIQAGTINTVQQVTGINGTTMYGDVISSSNAVKIADAWGSTTASATKSFMKYDSGIPGLSPFTYSIIGTGKAYFDGTNIIFSFYTNGYCVNNTRRTDTMYGMTITYNTTNNTYTHDLTSTPLICTGGISGSLTWSNPYSINSSKIAGIGADISDGWSSAWYITDSGIQYTVKEKYVLHDYYIITRCTIPNFTNKADAYKIRSKQLSMTSRSNVMGDFASRVGDQLVGGSPLSPTRIMFTGTGSYQGTQYTKYKRGIADIGSTRTYTYNSFDRGTITGYAPQNFRVPLSDTNENLTRSKISFCDAAGNISMYGCVFSEDIMLTTGYKLDSSTLTYDKTVSIDNSTLVALKNSIISTSGIDSANAKVGLYFSPDTSFCKSIACVVSKNTSPDGGNVLFATVDCTMVNNVVTVANLNTIFYTGSFPTMQSVLISSEMLAKSGLSCVKYSDFTYISFSGLNAYGTPGDSAELSGCGVVNGNTISNVTVSQSYHASGIATNAREYSYIPNVGFGYYIYANNDRGTKLIFKNCGNTLAQFNSNISPGTGTDIVILAQDVVQGFYLYFTEVTPLFMGGQYFDVPISTVDLNAVTSNPGNKTFYIYIQLILGTPTYVASLTEIPETAINMFIGTIQTDGTKVSALNISKVSRFDVYRPSLTQIGSGFPVSSGNPQQTGTINW